MYSVTGARSVEGCGYTSRGKGDQFRLSRKQLYQSALISKQPYFFVRSLLLLRGPNDDDASSAFADVLRALRLIAAVLVPSDASSTFTFLFDRLLGPRFCGDSFPTESCAASFLPLVLR